MTMLQNEPKALEDLLVTFTDTESSALSVDIARCNLICASEFPGVQPLDIDFYLARICFAAGMILKVDIISEKNALI